MRALVAALAALMLAAPVAAARPAPTGSFEMTPSGPYVEGQTVTFTVTTKGTGPHFEVTIGIDCFQPDGTQMRIGNLGNDSIYELTSIRGPWTGPQSVTLWTTGTGYDCRARLVAVQWFKGTPLRAWTLDTQSFSVEA